MNLSSCFLVFFLFIIICVCFCLKVNHSLDSLETLPLVGHEERLVDVWNGRHIGTAHTLDGGLQVEETLFLDEGGDLGTETLSQIGLVRDQQTACLRNGIANSFEVPRHNRSQIDDLTRNSQLFFWPSGPPPQPRDTECPRPQSSNQCLPSSPPLSTTESHSL